jgi:HEAT repeat protein
MAEPIEAPPPLGPEDTARLTEFARAFKAAARAVVLYPATHPAIAATLRRIAHVTGANLPTPMKLAVLPDTLMVDGHVPARPDAAIAELAEILHSHLIGELTVHPGGDVEAWHQFLLLLARTPDSLRAEGGIARVWTTMAGRHVEMREIDYAQVLRERSGGEAAVWDKVLAHCLQGDTMDLDEDAIREFLGIVSDPDKLGELMSTLEARADAAGGGIGAKAAALLRMLRGIIDVVSKNQPDRVDPVLRNMASAVGQLTPDAMMGLFTNAGEVDDGPRLVNSVVSRMTDKTIAGFVAKNIISESSPTDRLAQAFQTLVRDDEQRVRLLALAKDDVAASALGGTENFETVWEHVAEKLLTSYSDKSYVSDEYGRELSGARSRAIEVEEVSDDPPERISGWLGTVATSALRALDLTLLLDLLRIEEDQVRWGELMTPVIALIEDLMLVGDFDAAEQLVSLMVREAGPAATPARRQHAMIAIDRLVAGSMLRHVITHLATIDNEQFDRVKAMCISLGEVLVRPLAEALSVEERGRTRERLTGILLAFGASGRQMVERLKNSPNAAVRRTAIHLLREFGGSDALPDLTELLDDNEPQVQREAVRAILNIATDHAYQVLEQALTTGTTRSRDAIMQAIGGIRDERLTPLFAYILRHIDHRGPLAEVYLRAIESLGSLRDPEAVGPLKEALYKGEWWAPRRTRILRSAAAAALSRIGTPEARAALDEAANSRSRGVRSVARAYMAAASGRRAGVA